MNAHPDLALLALRRTHITGNVGKERFTHRRTRRRFQIQQPGQHAAEPTAIEDKLRLDGARRTVRILETTGINGIWMLCWLETAASAVSPVDLVGALLDCFGHEDATTLAARFIPVFAGNAPDSSVSAELQVLEARYPELVLPPIYQDAGGSLVLPSAQPHDEGTPS